MIEYKAPPSHYGERGWGRWLREKLGIELPTSSLPSESVGSLVLPASNQPDAQHTYGGKVAGALVEDVRITTHDQALLFGVQVTTDSFRKLPAQEQRYIIRFHGNGVRLSDSIDLCIEAALEYGQGVVGFNYRGVTQGSPKARRYQDLVEDGLAQVYRLLASGTRAEHLTLDGYSLGGAVASLVGAHCHEHGLKVRVFNDRSFMENHNSVALLDCTHSMRNHNAGSSFHRSI